MNIKSRLNRLERNRPEKPLQTFVLIEKPDGTLTPEYQAKKAEAQRLQAEGEKVQMIIFQEENGNHEKLTGQT